LIDRDAPVVIFGAGGQDGRYLVEAHRRRGHRVLSFSRTARDGLSRLDVSDAGAVSDVIATLRPRVVYQLAAVSTTRHDAVWENHAAVVTGTLATLEAAWRHSRETAVVAVGSALQFQNRGVPIHETHPFEASSAYAVARIQAAYAARYYRTLGLRAYVAYLFHHESPERKPPHVSASICRDVAAIARGLADVVEIGDLTVEKEWGYAGDVAEGLAVLAEQTDAFEVVVGTGEVHTIEDWVERCFSHVGLSPAGRVRQREGFRTEYRRIVSQPDTLRRLGWSTRLGFDELAAKMMERALVSQSEQP
jgi:GDPmannose 4,6-dehydratase